MAMQHLENELRRTGDSRKQAFADVIAGIHKSLGSDIPLPSATTPVEQSADVKNPEASVKIKRFSQEAREGLDEQGFTVLELTGRSIAVLRDSGREFWSDWHRDYPDFEALGSMHSEVAIKRDELFLPKSQSKTFDEQARMVEEFSKKLGSKIPGVEAVMGEAPDYVELAFAYLDKTQGKDYLFGAKDNYHYTRTKTRVGSGIAVVGGFFANVGLLVIHWVHGARGRNVKVAPLVVPV